MIYGTIAVFSTNDGRTRSSLETWHSMHYNLFSSKARLLIIIGHMPVVLYLERIPDPT